MATRTFLTSAFDIVYSCNTEVKNKKILCAFIQDNDVFIIILFIIPNPQKSTLTTASSGSPFSPTVPEVYDVVDCTVDDLKEIVTTDDDRKPLKNTNDSLV